MTAKTETDGFTIEFSSGPIKFSSEEGVLYTRIFNIVDCSKNEFIGGLEGAAFIRRAQLSNDINREIWRLACGGKSQTKMNKDSWFVAMKLVALAQSTGRCKIQPLLTGEYIPLADFKLNGPPDNKLLKYKTMPQTCINIQIKSPVVVGSGYSRYTQYIVISSGSLPQLALNSVEVRRRFSDFEWLHQRLRQRFRGTIIPPVPEKKWTGNMDATFVEERRQALEHYINEVAVHPKLRTTLELQVLLTACNEGIIAAKELMPVASTNVTDMVPTASSVTSLWSTMKEGLGMSSSVQLVDIKTNDDYLKIGQAVEEYEKYVAEAVRTSDAIYQAQRGQGYEMSRFGSYLSAMAVHEREDEVASQFLECTGEMFDTVSNIFQDQLDMILSQYVLPMRYQIGKVGAIKTVMENRQLAIQEVQAASASMQRNKERFAAARASSGAAASAMIAEQKMSQAEDRMNIAKDQVDFIAESLKNEMERFNKEKRAEMQKCLLANVRLQIEYRQKSRLAWESLLKRIDFDARQFRAGSTGHRPQ